MTINEAMRTYRLPNPTTLEDLECRWSKVLNFGDRVLLAGYYWDGKGKPCYFGAVYEHLDNDLSCEGAIDLLKECFAAATAFEGEMPGKSAVECGNYINLDVETGKAVCKFYANLIAGWTVEKLSY